MKRREVWRDVKVVLLVLGLVMLSQAVCTVYANSDQPQECDLLRVALKMQPSSLDLHWAVDNLIRNVTCHVYETLFAFDTVYQPTPLLVDTFEITDDGLIHTFHLRQGIRFHNGQTMTSADVVASLNRWLRISSFGRKLAQYTDSVVAIDDYTVQLTLNGPVNFVEMFLASWRQGAGIYPASVVEAAGDGLVTECIGTGPYRLVEWKEDESILLERYPGYRPVDSPASGYAGRRAAYARQIKFIFVPEDAVRRLGVETGDFDIALDVSRESYARYEEKPNIQSIIGGPRMTTVILNKKAGLMTNLKIRQAVQAAICVDSILPVYGNELFWRVDPSITWKETAWWSDAGSERYNMCNPDRARQLLAEAGYDGTVIKYALNVEDKSKYDVAQIVKQQLEAVGFNVEFQVRDAAAHEECLRDSERWDINMSEHTYRFHPILHSHLKATSYGHGWWTNEEKEELVDELVLTKTYDEAFRIWEQIQELYYEDVPLVKIGDFFEYAIATSALKGYANMPEPFFWNVWVEGEG